MTDSQKVERILGILEDAPEALAHLERLHAPHLDDYLDPARIVLRRLVETIEP